MNLSVHLKVFFRTIWDALWWSQLAYFCLANQAINIHFIMTQHVDDPRDSHLETVLRNHLASFYTSHEWRTTNYQINSQIRFQLSLLRSLSNALCVWPFNLIDISLFIFVSFSCFFLKHGQHLIFWFALIETSFKKLFCGLFSGCFRSAFIIDDSTN